MRTFATLASTVPRFGFVGPCVFAVVFLLYKLISSMPSEDYYDRDATERLAAMNAAKANKTASRIPRGHPSKTKSSTAKTES